MKRDLQVVTTTTITFNEHEAARIGEFVLALQDRLDKDEHHLKQHPGYEMLLEMADLLNGVY